MQISVHCFIFSRYIPIFILVGKGVLLVCIKSALIMSFPARTINKTPLNRLQLFFSVKPLLHRFRHKLGFEIGILRPSRPSVCSPFNLGTNQCCTRTGQVAVLPNVTIPFWFIRPTFDVLILNLIDCTRYMY